MNFKSLITASSMTLMCQAGLAQGVDIKQDRTRSTSRDVSIDLSAASYIQRGLAKHGSERVRDCLDKVTNFYAIKTDDPWSMPSITKDAQQWTSRSVCMLALNQLANEIQASIGSPSRPKSLPKGKGRVLPAAESKDAAKFFSVSADAEAKAFAQALADTSNLKLIVDQSSAGKYMRWALGKYSFTADGGQVSMLFAGRPIYDQDHINGERITMKVSASAGTTDTDSFGKTAEDYQQ